MEQRQQRTKIRWVRLLGITAGVYASMRFLLPFVYPFALAIILVIPLHPWLKRMEKRLHIGPGVLMGILLLVFSGLGVFLLWNVCGCVTECVTDFWMQREQWEKELGLLVSNGCQLLEDCTGLSAKQTKPVILGRIGILLEETKHAVLPGMLRHCAGFAGSAVRRLTGFLVTFIGAVLLAKDYEHIEAWLNKREGGERLLRLPATVGRLIGTYVKAQLVILAGIFSLVTVGCLIIGVEHPIRFGVLAGALDMLPFIGTGIVLVPLFVGELLQGSLVRAIGCLVLYVICIFFRELLEPRLIGTKIGFYPVVILAAIYLGVKLYGLCGVILGPLSLFVIRELMREREDT